MTAQLRSLISGLDTIQAAYYLRPHFNGAFEFEPLMVARERLRADKSRKGELLSIGGESFLLQGYGSKSGYPLVLDHVDFTVECGEFNNPSFFVTYRSKALWEKGAKVLHEFFVSWAESAGLLVIRREKLSRVDFAFDYELPAPDFDSDSVVSLSAKDAQYRVSTGVILTHPTGVKVTHLGEDGSFAEAADVDPGASSGDTSHGPTGRRIEGDRAASGMFA